MARPAGEIGLAFAAIRIRAAFERPAEGGRTVCDD